MEAASAFPCWSIADSDYAWVDDLERWVPLHFGVHRLAFIRCDRLAFIRCVRIVCQGWVSVHIIRSARRLGAMACVVALNHTRHTGVFSGKK
eukprot:6194963-Pleurochrysis_carterae.AAC.3